MSRAAREIFLQAAADVLCAQLGYDFGTVSTSACGEYGGANLCGASGSPVAMSNLICDGSELGFQDCSASAPDSSCLDHSFDSVVFCGKEGASTGIAENTVRLLSHDGSPSVDGLGRVEMFHSGSWTPICKSGFTNGAASVACKAMGFTGAQPLSDSATCNYDGKDFCGTVAPRISEVSCSGQESGLGACQFEESDNVFCAPQESVVLQCAGAGDSQGRAEKVTVPVVA